jgi:hypothetical protein
VPVDGRTVLPLAQLGKPVDAEGRFDDNMVRAGCRFFSSPAARRQLMDEIRAQFLTFRATRLTLNLSLHRSVEWGAEASRDRPLQCAGRPFTISCLETTIVREDTCVAHDFSPARPC